MKRKTFGICIGLIIGAFASIISACDSNSEIVIKRTESKEIIQRYDAYSIGAKRSLEKVLGPLTIQPHPEGRRTSGTYDLEDIAAYLASLNDEQLDSLKALLISSLPDSCDLFDEDRPCMDVDNYLDSVGIYNVYTFIDDYLVAEDKMSFLIDYLVDVPSEWQDFYISIAANLDSVVIPLVDSIGEHIHIGFLLEELVSSCAFQFVGKLAGMALENAIVDAMPPLGFVVSATLDTMDALEIIDAYREYYNCRRNR